MYYTIYKITNLLNEKHYIGKHKTKDLNDGYMGSGKLLRLAIERHGLDNFTKEILFTFSTEEEMNSKEKELVVVSEETYNLCEGGQGGFSHIDRLGTKHSNTTKSKMSISHKGHQHSEEVKSKIRASNKGKHKNDLGGRWLHHPITGQRKRAKDVDPWLSKGFILGRKITSE